MRTVHPHEKQTRKRPERGRKKRGITQVLEGQKKRKSTKLVLHDKWLFISSTDLRQTIHQPKVGLTTLLHASRCLRQLCMVSSFPLVGSESVEVVCVSVV